MRKILNFTYATYAYHVLYENGKTSLVFEQLSERANGGTPGPSITNTIEDLVNWVVNKELKDVHPDELSIFEYYPDNAIREWAEVKLSIFQTPKYTVIKNIIKIKLAKFFGKKIKVNLLRWSFSDPQWFPVNAKTIDSLIKNMY